MSDSPAGWGSAREMSPFEVMMWRAEGDDPRFRSPVLAVELLDAKPDWDRLVAAVDWATRMVPRFRERIREPLGGLGTPYWIHDLEFDLHYHLRRVRIPGAGPGFWAELSPIAEQFMMTPFDRERPPWEAMLVEGLPGGRAAFLLKLHHVLTDGMGVVQLLSQLHSRKREHDDTKPQPAAPEPTSPDPLAEVDRLVRREAGIVPAAARAARDVVGALTHPLSAARDTARYLDSALRVLSPPPGSGSELLRPRGMSWRFVALDVDFADLRAAGKSVGGSFNDAFVASLLGAFRLYHEAMGHPVTGDATLRTSVPVSVRREGDAAGGNRWAPARLAAPMGVADPARRIREVSEQMRAARSEPALESPDVVAPLLARLPGPLLTLVAGGSTQGNDLQASNVPGLRSEAFLCGARIDRVYPFAPLPGCAAMISVVTHGDLCCVGANIDAAAITDREEFARCLAGGFAEVLALQPGAAEPMIVG
ncbi:MULTISPECIES: wax ester/triacylglycerol synthase domain-containing protein [Pseudonocardia]|uniref:wax ester/triacylglycerol synthase domain-containing protein n=1 Tax=Pseudonocardia TaxID=1847 RepID=UPI0020977090|nr:wax ester/triacylglycerol synthase domain-containing protein [Pseudonocardia sp. McavD-2-B]MCO7195569.1 WS/DGAT domain-containing protein [Pseudonocardia sp. McavD-2-B]